MSRGNKLQEMEVDVQESHAVTAGAAAADKSLPKAGSNAAGVSTPGNSGSWEDLGGPTPENYKVDDDSAKLKTPGATLKQVKDVVNKGAKSGVKSGDVQPGTKLNSGDEVEVKADQEVVAEEPAKEDEVVAEEDLKKKVEDAITEEPEAKEDEVVAESSEEEVAPEINVEEYVEALLQGEELSEEFQAKAKTIFEAAINSKVATIKEELEQENSKKLEEEIESKKLELTERVDSYLEYVAGEWLQENELAVEAGLKTEMTESFLEGMKSLFEEHYVTIPDEKYDVLNSMVEKLDEMESKLNEQIDRNVSLNKRLAESSADVIFAEVTEGLALSSRDKLKSLAEKIEFASEDDYREKLATLKESYFPANGTPKQTTETISEGVAPAAPADVSKSMEAYMASLGRIARK